MELTVLLTPLIFITLFLRISLNSSMSAAENTVTMSNSPVTSYSSSILSSLDSAATTLSISGDSTKTLTNASRRDTYSHLSQRDTRRVPLNVSVKRTGGTLIVGGDEICVCWKSMVQKSSMA